MAGNELSAVAKREGVEYDASADAARVALAVGGSASGSAGKSFVQLRIAGLGKYGSSPAIFLEEELQEDAGKGPGTLASAF